MKSVDACPSNEFIRGQNNGEAKFPVEEEIKETTAGSARNSVPFCAALIETDVGLLGRLQANLDEESWRKFYEIYGVIIRFAAARYGLQQSEWDDVLQEVMVEMTKRLPAFRYDPERCRFRTWLMHIVRSKIVNQLRKRTDEEPLGWEAEQQFERKFEESWDEQWKERIGKEAFRRVQLRVRPALMQTYDLLVVQERSGREVAKLLRITRISAYMRKFRIERELKREREKLEIGDF